MLNIIVGFLILFLFTASVYADSITKKSDTEVTITKERTTVVSQDISLKQLILQRQKLEEYILTLEEKLAVLTQQILEIKELGVKEEKEAIPEEKSVEVVADGEIIR